MTKVNASGKVTLSDVAALAGVSKSAVSIVLNNGKGRTTKVAESTAMTIREAAALLKYRPNLVAQSLAGGRTGFIGFMLASSVSRGFMNPYFAGFLHGAEAECRRRGYGLAVACAPVAEADSFIQSGILGQRRIDALLLAGEIDTCIYAELNLSGIPYIVLNGAPSENDVPLLGVPAQPSVIRYAASKGHRRIILPENRGSDKFSEEKMLCLVRKTAEECGVSVELLRPAEGFHPNWEPGYGLGRHLFERWMASHESERASFIAGNAVLFEFYQELVKAGLRCPENVSLFGDNSLENFAAPVFSRRNVPHEMIGADAVSLLIGQIESGIPLSIRDCASKEYPGEIIEGETLKEIIQWHPIGN